MTRCGRLLGCVVMAAVTNGCHMPVHLFGRYDCRSGAVQEQRDGSELIRQLLDEAAKEKNDVDASAN